DGRMQPSGLCAYEARDPEKSGVYSFEQRHSAQLDPALEKKFRANRKAWKFFQEQPPGYRKISIFFVMSAKREETRVRRLDRLIEDSAAGRRLGLMGREPK
ncbi:MAG TPA: YdeI/OmpD-associated family protein, partial [Thermoanaerobaculia bacterium]|nr:YdeI/OmpD-associated family protein [Thermoanaerobaculia bacterium]